MDSYIGKLLDNRYEILEMVGTGGMAKVYKARCHRLNRLVAIKILRDDLSQDAEFRRRFHDESQAVAMLSHPNIVAVYDVSRSSELEYIVMELIDGITLKQYMQKKGNKLNWREALHFVTQITKALGHAHSRGIIHRDIKPHNVMVLRDGSVKVADFGIARVASGGHSTLTQEALGSVHYISPEQARGSHIDARSDLYSAGVVLYEMITGRLPFEGDTPVSVAIQHINSIPLSPRELDPSIPEALEAITMKAMAPNPDDRYLSADEMLADLEEFRKNPNINFDYSVSEFAREEGADDDRTQVRPVHTGGISAGERREQSRGRSYEEDYPSVQRRDQRYYDEDDEEDYPRRGPVWPVFLAAIAVLLFVGLVVYFLVNTVFSGLTSKPETTLVPNLLGKTYEEIKGDTDLLGRFTLAEGGTVSDEAEPGTIIKQDPEAGSEVGEAVSEITVTISAGPDTVTMPPLDDMEYQEACRLLRENGLKPVVPPEYATHDTIEEGRIISYTPEAGLELPPATEVYMVVSRGPEVKEITMPKLVDMTRERAELTISQHNLDLKNSRFDEDFDSEVPAGKVISQYPTEGTKVFEGTTVNLVISKGPDPSTQTPDPPPTTDPDNNPGTTPDNNPGTTPDNNPGTTPDNNPGTTPDNNPGTTPDNNPGTTPDNNPGTTPDNNPGTTPDNNPDTNPGTDPGNDTTPKPVTKTAHVSLNGYEGEVNVRVLMDGSQIFNQDVDTSMDTGVDVPVQGTTGMGVKELAVYINGVASGTVSVNFDS